MGDNKLVKKEKNELALSRPFEVVMVDKPKMAIAYENKKLRDYSEPERKAKVIKEVAYILNLLGVNEGKLPHHAVAIDLIHTVYLNSTFEEIRLAFQMYASGQFYEEGKPMYIAQNLNGVVIGRVMHAYEQDKKEKLIQYEKERRKQIESKEKTEEEKLDIIRKGVVSMYQNWVDSGRIIGSAEPVYRYLEKRNDLPNWTEEELESAEEEALINVENSVKNSGNFDLDLYFSKGRNKEQILESAKCKVLLIRHYIRISKNNNKK